MTIARRVAQTLRLAIFFITGSIMRRHLAWARDFAREVDGAGVAEL